MQMLAVLAVVAVREWRRDLLSFLAEVDGFFDGVLAVAVGFHLRPPVRMLTQH